MRRFLALAIFCLVFLGTLPSGNAQSQAETLLLPFEYESVPIVQPARISSTMLSEIEHIEQTVRNEDGSIYFLVSDWSNFSLVRYRFGEFSSRIVNFSRPNDSYFFVTLDHSLFIGEGRIEPTGSVFHITVMDLEGNTLSENNITYVAVYIDPIQFLVGEDGLYYLIGREIYSHELHLTKIDNDGTILWDKVVGTSWSVFIDLLVIPSGQIIILKPYGVESRNSDGEFLWNTVLSNNSIWAPVSIRRLDSGSICVFYSYETWVPPIPETGVLSMRARIFRCSIDGTILWNTTIIARDSSQTEVDLQLIQMETTRDTIHIMLNVEEENNLYLLDMSKNLNGVNRWALKTQTLSDIHLQFDSENAPVIFGKNDTSDKHRLVAFSFGTAPRSMVLIVSGSIIGLFAIILIWRERNRF